ncbi:MAG: hypothetical protein PHW80_07220 [Smithellaceae bacterium]|jgi:hypothetical protein|nr:hypothetical protein [Smithellaceae bacterium]MDD3259432.1 hypothetical protein [Smithellaceae bacterium]MDD3849074.1 hypothetical protein [Smithellaceae bacterium]HOG12490.1 hypothetical protein [Smithellaceae bacterium]HOQ72024.1 hypothetical protein [Smithellaceae bacterium]
MPTEFPIMVLCQPDPGKSCGACCGLYNYVDSSRESLVKRLSARTRRYHEMVKGPEDLPRYAKATFAAEDFRKRYEVIYCCEYLGFLDAEEKKVGCLVHPLQNGGVDMRTVSFYGRDVCAGHLCPSHHFIPRSQQLILLKIIDDWYLYGLCLTDIDLVVSWFRLVADRVGEELKPEAFERQDLKEAALQYFRWKMTWPFRCEEANRLGKYYFDGSQYMISHIDYEKFGRDISPLNAILLSLSSEFHAAEELDQAEKMIWSNVEALALLYRGRL